MKRRFKTDKPGIFYREAIRIGGKGVEKVYYAVYKKNGKIIETKIGRQYADGMTPAKAAVERAGIIEGRIITRKEKRQAEEAIKKAEESRWTINRLFNAYIKTRSEGKSRKTDKGRYKNYIKVAFGDKEPKEVIPLDVERFRRKLQKKLAPQTVKHILNLLTWVINYGTKNGICAGLSFQIKKPTVNNIKIEDLNPEQFKRLMAAIEKSENIPAKNIMKLALFTGMRRGEMFKLKWKDIDFDRGFISIIDPKGGPDQKIPLNKNARNLLQSHPKNRSKFVFPGRNGRQRTDINHQVNAIKDAAGLPKDFRALHGLRHVYASMLASSGKIDMYTLQKLLTHKDPRMTQRYAHLRDDAMKRASAFADDIMDAAINDKTKKVVHIREKK